MGLDNFPRPPTHRSAAAATGSKTFQSRDRYESYSPPRTPPQQSGQQRQHGLGLRSSYPETFLDDTVENGRASESGDEPDPHDLALSPKHVTRASVVDNMLLSLDQFVSGSPLIDDYRFFGGGMDSHHYDFSTNLGRLRGHTFSSSMSSDVDRGVEENAGYDTMHASRGHRSNSSTTSQQVPRRYDSLRGYEDSRRVRSARQESQSSVSSVDFHGGRRSASLDYGSRPLFLSDDLDDIEAAPTPTVPAGPRRDIPNPLGDFSAAMSPSFPPPRTPALSRRNSNKSSKSTATKKGRSDTLGTASMKGREDSAGRDLPPPLPSSYVDPAAPSPTISFNKPIFPAVAPSAEPAPAKERPGFFRRVFGSSKNSSSSTSEPQSTQLPQLGVTGPENDFSTRGGKQPPRSNPPGNSQANHENFPPVVSKKASSFFRRRKKSVVDHVPPPLNLSAGGLKPLDQLQPEPSPVSSLRKVMNPYLADSISPAGYDPKGDSDGENVPEQPAAREQRAVEGSAKNGVLKTKYSLNLPILSHENDDSFLADSNGDEATSGVSSHRERPERPKTSPEAPGHVSVADADYHQSFLNSKLSVSTQSSRGKERIELQPGSFLSAPDSPKDRRASKEGGAESPRASNSDVSQYHTASNTPLMETPVIPMEESKPQPQPSGSETADDQGGVASGDLDDVPSPADREIARRLFENQAEVVGSEPAAAWLGSPDRAMIRKAYMELFNWTNIDILGALRSLCTKMALKGETQQVDRVLDALSARWCECNPNHGFKAVDVVHTICYSLLLLNTDLHVADIEQKMTKNQFVRNTMPTIYRVACDAAPDGFETIRPGGKSRIHAKLSDSISGPVKSPTLPPSDLRLGPGETTKPSTGGPVTDSDARPLVNTPFHGTIKAWEAQVETVLKDFYNSIQKQPLPLHNSPPDGEAAHSSNTHLGHGLRRSPSTLSKSGSDIFPRGRSADSRLTTGRWSSKPRSRARLYPSSNIGSSRTSLDESTVWSPSASSTWSKYSLGKTLTSVSMDSLGSEYPRGDYQQSIGFANALSHAIIREDSAHSIASFEEPAGSAALLEDEILELAGAPWAKEGNLKHKQHLDAVDKRAKDRNWNECFAVIQRGWLRLFSFNSTRSKTKQRGGGVVVGGGNWMENAEETWKFLLRQTIASALPPPGYSKSRPHVWALSLPTGAVHLFQAGTAEIVKEFVTTANYWSARLSKEPLIGGVSNMEYGWSDAIINSALINIDTRSPPSSSGAPGAPRPSLQGSIRSSIDQQGVKARLPADRAHISDWTPPQQSMMASTLSEADQLKALQNYVKSVEEELQKHNELRQPMILAFSPRHPNGAKAMANWERKSSYLLREIVKFRTYIDALQLAQAQKEKIYASRLENDEGDDHSAEVSSIDGQHVAVSP
ncbi:hypothetical protein VTN77DRAFT_9146 [Rasamsonia byssochlamydoides]|uniref:uncharacterized protein n=1 Tax=Rasamsonia byssochlamydoides TaxID=89139 RepID=UPI003744A086